MITTQIIVEKDWVLLETIKSKNVLITMSKGDVIIFCEKEYIVKRNILDLDERVLQIIVEES